MPAQHKDHKIFYPLFRSKTIDYISHYDKDTMNVKLKTGETLTFRDVPGRVFKKWMLSDAFDDFYLANIEKVYYSKKRNFLLERILNRLIAGG